MIPVRGYAGHKVAVLGLGRSGRPAMPPCAPAAPRSSPGTTAPPPARAAEADGIALADLTGDACDGVKALIVSPGIPHLYPAPHPAVAAAWDAGVAVDNDIGLFFRSFATPAWDEVRPGAAGGRHHRLERQVHDDGADSRTPAEAGRPVQIGGNIGRGVLDLDPAQDGMVVVLELSSYQIELARALQPDIAVFLNLSPDHLDRHGGLGGYFAAKRRLFTQGGPARSIIGVDENEGRFLANAMREEAGTGDPVITVSVDAQAGGDRAGSVYRAQGLPRRVARAAGRSPRSTCARWRRCPARTTTRTPAPPMPPRAASAWPRARSRRRSRAIPASPHRSQLIATWRGVTHRQRLARRPTSTPPRRRWRASSASAGSPAGGRRRAGSRRCGRCSRGSPRPT